MPEEKDLGFKVSDRRLFNQDGSPRDIEFDAAPPAPAQPPSAPASNASAGASSSASASAAGSQFAPESDTDAGREEDEMTEFMGAIMNIASPAFIYLGLADHPATGRPQIDLGAAQQYIDILAILREKTRGNLSRSEEEFFDGILSDMRMQFVALRNQMPGGIG